MQGDSAHDWLEDGRETLPPSEWSTKTKRPEVLAIAACPCCGRRPPTLDPLPKGWAWDTLEPSNPWVWCPMWIEGAEQTGLEFEANEVSAAKPQQELPPGAAARGKGGQG